MLWKAWAIHKVAQHLSQIIPLQQLLNIQQCMKQKTKIETWNAIGYKTVEHKTNLKQNGNKGATNQAYYFTKLRPSSHHKLKRYPLDLFWTMFLTNTIATKLVFKHSHFQKMKNIKTCTTYTQGYIGVQYLTFIVHFTHGYTYLQTLAKWPVHEYRSLDHSIILF